MAAENILEQQRYTIAIVGDAGTGKTALRQRVCDKRFVEIYESTIGTNIGAIIYPEYFARLQLLDCAGRNLYRPATLSFLKTASPAACVLLFDITQRESFIGLTTWLKEMEESNPDLSKDKILLVGNKIDLKETRQVSREEAEEFSKERGLMRYVEMSAKTNENVTVVFETILEKITSNHLFKNKVSAPDFRFSFSDKKSPVETAPVEPASICFSPTCTMF